MAHLLLCVQFATTDADTKRGIVQRGAVPPLVAMLSHEDVSLREMAAFALGRLAQDKDNQAGIVQVRRRRPSWSHVSSSSTAVACARARGTRAPVCTHMGRRACVRLGRVNRWIEVRNCWTQAGSSVLALFTQHN